MNGRLVLPKNYQVVSDRECEYLEGGKKIDTRPLRIRGDIRAPNTYQYTPKETIGHMTVAAGVLITVASGGIAAPLGGALTTAGSAYASSIDNVPPPALTVGPESFANSPGN